MADLGLISVVVSGAVAISATVTNFWAAERRARESREADLRKRNWAREDELRSVLDAASNAFHDAHLSVTRAAKVLDESAPAPRKTEAFETLSTQMRRLWEEENRLAVRLGLEHPIVASFVTGVVQYQKARSLLMQDRHEMRGSSPEAVRLATLAVDLQHEFWRRASASIGPNGEHPHETERVNTHVAEREQRLRPIIEATLSELNKGSRALSVLPAETDEATTIDSPRA